MGNERNYRERITSDLVKTMLGPKFGIYESLHNRMNPWKLYLTGVLSPSDSEIEENSEATLNNFVEFEEGDKKDALIDDPDDNVPFLSSKSQPRSFGISFVVKTETDSSSF